MIIKATPSRHGVSLMLSNGEAYALFGTLACGEPADQSSHVVRCGILAELGRMLFDDERRHLAMPRSLENRKSAVQTGIAKLVEQAQVLPAEPRAAAMKVIQGAAEKLSHLIEKNAVRAATGAQAAEVKPWAQ
jgi:hypothetical protein